MGVQWYEASSTEYKDCNIFITKQELGCCLKQTNKKWINKHTKNVCFKSIFQFLKLYCFNIRSEVYSLMPWEPHNRQFAAAKSIHFNTLGSSDAYMRQWPESSLVQVMVCCLFGDKSLPKSRPSKDWRTVNWNLNDEFLWNIIQNKNPLFQQNSNCNMFPEK